MTKFVLEIDGHRHNLPSAARVLLVPRLGLALVRVGKKVMAASAVGVDKRFSADDLSRLWKEWTNE